MEATLHTPDFHRQTSSSTAAEKPGIYGSPSPYGTYTGFPGTPGTGDNSNDYGANEKGKTNADEKPQPKKRKSYLRQRWDRAVEIGRWARIVYSLVGFLLIILWLAVMWVSFIIISIQSS
jgi:hypothetical protein